jgi:hypothetical protein
MALQAVSSPSGDIMEAVIAKGDLSKLLPEQRARYYSEVCRSTGLNPLTQPFEYITLNGKLTLYARRTATDQLRKLNQVNVRVVDRSVVNDVLVVTVEATDRDGRVDTDIGAVAIGGLKGEAYANAIMKATTKAKRRVTLSICGLGWLDETEVESVPSARPATVDIETGEIIDADPAPRQTTHARPAIELMATNAETGEIIETRPEPQPEPTAGRVNLSGLHGDIKRRFEPLLGDLIDVHLEAKRLGAFWFGVNSLTDLTPKQLHDFRKKLRDLTDDDLMAEHASAVDFGRQAGGQLAGMPEAVAAGGEPGNDRFSR